MVNEPSPESEPTPSDLSRWGPLVGVLASCAICVQNAGFGTGMGWALIHGAGPLALLALLPLALGLVVLWAGFRFLRREQVRQGLAQFVGLSIAILALNEWLLPTTPLKAWSSEGALKSAELSSIRDEIVTTATGDPIGLRLVFEVRFPRRVVANISASAFAPSEREPPWLPGQLDFQGYEQTIEPAPESEEIYEVFEKDAVYRVEIVRRPGFRPVDPRTGQPCRGTPPGLSDNEILTALRRRGNRHYRGEIHASSDNVPVSVVVAEYETSQPYDLEAMYRSVMQEQLEPCPG